ncbi:MAG: putative rane protein [Myxococcales bacterium]|nr:putative rane protein [Myxococcales bacterium]
MASTETYSTWWLLLLRGILSFAFGVLALIQPLAALAALVALFGAWALIDGAAAIALWLSGWRSWQLALIGVVGILTAAITLFRPELTAIGLYAAIAAWSLARGALEIALAIKLRRTIEGEVWLLFGGIFSILFGVLMIALPMAGVLVLAWLIATYAMIVGVLLIALSLRLRQVGRPAPIAPMPIGTPHAV